MSVAAAVADSSSPPAQSSAAIRALEKQSAALAKAEEKKVKTRRKKIFDQCVGFRFSLSHTPLTELLLFTRLKKECKSPTCKFQGSSKSIRFEEVLEKTEFDALFEGKGILIQPTPNNKPVSAVTIISVRGDAALGEVFGDELKPLKGEMWNIGGA